MTAVASEYFVDSMDAHTDKTAQPCNRLCRNACYAVEPHDLAHISVANNSDLMSSPSDRGKRTHEHFGQLKGFPRQHRASWFRRFLMMCFAMISCWIWL